MYYFSNASRLGVGRSFLSFQWAAGDFTQEKGPGVNRTALFNPVHDNQNVMRFTSEVLYT